MIADIAIAFPAAVLAAILLWPLNDPVRGGLAGKSLLVLAVTLALAALFTPAFDGYRSDLWVYLAVSERIAAGDWLLGREPFRLEPPAGPHHSAIWILTGLLNRWLHIPVHTLARLAGILGIGLALFAGWRLASAALPERRALASALFLLSLSGLWAAIGLNRNVAIPLAMLAAAETLKPSGRFPLASLWIALAFWVHFFGGLLACGAFALAVMAASKGPPPFPWKRHLLALAAGLTGALPPLAYHLSNAGTPVLNPDYLWGPGQFTWNGLRLLNPLQLLREIPPTLLVLGMAGLLTSRWSGPLLPSGLRLSRYGSAAVALLLLTPLYHLFSEHLGGWLALRTVPLAFLWLPAAAAIATLTRPEQGLPARLAATLLAACIFWQGAARVVRDFRHDGLHFPFSAGAQAEARSFRPLLEGRHYLSIEGIAYALAAPTLGHPAAVTPGRASPFHPWKRRAADLSMAFSANSVACWAEFFRRHPETEYLVTPSPEAAVERQLWNELLPGISPESVREKFMEPGALDPAAEGRWFIVDRIDTGRIVTAESGTCAALQAE